MRLLSNKTMLWLGALLAVAYNSWVLGFILNTQVAQSGLASDLEASGQPFNWLFIFFDIICGLLAVSLAVGMYFRYRASVVAAIGTATFGLMTAVSAVIPEHCKQDIARCGYQTTVQTFGWHDLTGALAAVGLFMALLASCRLEWSVRWNRFMMILTLIWSLWGITFGLIAIPTINQLSFIATAALIWQQIFLVVSGIGIFAVVYTIIRRKDVSSVL